MVPSVSAQVSLEFDAPAQLKGTATAGGLEWALLVFHDSETVLDMALDGPVVLANHTHAEIRTEEGPFPMAANRIPVGPGPTSETTPGPVTGRMTFSKQWASLVVFADDLQFIVNGTAGTLDRAEAGANLGSLVTAWSPVWTYRVAGYQIPDDGAALTAFQKESAPFTLKATGVTRMEWHNATVTCSTAACPDGGAYVPIGPNPIQDRASTWQRTYIESQSKNGTLTGQGSVFIVAAGGRVLDTELDGWIRLPQAKITGMCGDAPCADPAGRAFLAEGNVHMEGLRPAADSPNRLSTRYEGTLESATFDETPVLLTSTGQVVAGAAVVIGFGLLAKLLAFLFARKTGPVLEHPSSKQLFESIQASPGQSFRELRRHMGWGGGQLATHLRRLEGAKLIVRREHGRTTRFFENHGRFDQSWKGVTVLQDPACRAVHDWLVLNPGVTQRTLVDHAESAWGLGRRRIQVILRHLQEAQLLSGIRTGRIVRYSAQPFASSAGDAGAVAA